LHSNNNNNNNNQQQQQQTRAKDCARRPAPPSRSPAPTMNEYNKCTTNGGNNMPRVKEGNWYVVAARPRAPPLAHK
jgi:hypothetical protein